MKNALCIIIAMFIFVLTGCSSSPSDKQTDDYYKCTRTGITEIAGTSQMSDPVEKVVLPSASVEKFLKQIEELCLQPTDADDDKKGWEYLFVVKYDDGSTTSISLSEEKIIINGKVYKTTLYKSNDFSAYFD